MAVIAAIGAVAAERDARPHTLHFAIRVLDQLSRRMRATDTAHDDQHRDRSAARARRRHGAPEADGLKFAFRAGAWPPWVALDDNGDPLLDGDELVLAERPGIQAAPDRGDPTYRQTLRDAQLVAGLWPRAEVDGRTTMAAGGSDYDLETARRRARPGPYPPPSDRRAEGELADHRLAQLAAIPLRAVQQLSAELRDELLEQHSIQCDGQRAAEREALWARFAEFGIRREGYEDV